MMRKILFAAIAAVALHAAGVGGAFAQYDGENRWMRIHNDSNAIANEIFIMPAGRDCCWSSDLQEFDIIRERESRFVKFSDGSRQCLFDIRITAPNPLFEWNFDGINVCSTHAIRLKPVSDLPGSSGDTRRRQVTVKNDSSLEALTVLIMPTSKDCCWSTDVLGKDVKIPPKRSRVVNFDDGSSECVFDILALSSKRGTNWNFDQINVCNEAGIAQKWITLKDAPPPISDNKKRQMTVTNDSSFQATDIAIIPSSQDCCWSPDLLGTNELEEEVVVREKGARVVDFNDGRGSCEVDIRITGQGREWNFDAVDVCNRSEEMRRITLK